MRFASWAWKEVAVVFAAAMGHTVEVHHRSYRTSEWKAVRSAFAQESWSATTFTPIWSTTANGLMRLASMLPLVQSTPSSLNHWPSVSSRCRPSMKVGSRWLGENQNRRWHLEVQLPSATPDLCHCLCALNRTAKPTATTTSEQTFHQRQHPTRGDLCRMEHQRTEGASLHLLVHPN